MKDKNKSLGIFSFKGLTTSGNQCRHIFTVLDNGIIDINQVILSEEEHLEGFKPITRRFGKTLHVNAIGFKLSTINRIVEKSMEVLVENKIDVKNIL